MSQQVFIDNQSVNNINEIRLPKDSTGVDMISFYDTSEANFSPDNLLVGKTAYAGDGLVAGTMPKLSVVDSPNTVQIDGNTISGITLSEGYVESEVSKVSIEKSVIADYLTEGGQEFSFKAYEPIPPGSEVCHKIDFNLSKSVITALNSTSYMGGYQSTNGRIKMVDCGEGYFVVFHQYSSSEQLYATPFYVNPTTNAITAGTSLALSTTSGAGWQFDAIPLKKKNETKTNHIFVCYSYNTSYYIYGMVVSITKGATPSCAIKTAGVALYTNTYESYYPIACCQMTDDGHILISCQYNSNCYLAVRAVSVNMSTFAITKGASQYTTTVYSNGTIEGSHNIFRLTDSTALILTRYDSNLYAGVVTCAKGGTPSFGTFSSRAVTYSSYDFDAIQIADNKFEVIYTGSNSYELCGALLTVNGTTVAWGASYSIDGQDYAGGQSGYNGLHLMRSNKNHAYFLSAGNQQQTGYIMGKELFINGTDPSKPMNVKYGGTTSPYSNIDTASSGCSYWRHGLIDGNSGNLVIACQYSSSYYLYAIVVPGYFALSKNQGINPFGMSLNETEIAAGEMVTARSFADNLPIKDYLMFR